MSSPLLERLAGLPAYSVTARMLREAFGVEVVLVDFNGAAAHQAGGVRTPPCGACKSTLFEPEGFERCASFYRDFDSSTPAPCHLGLKAMGASIGRSAQLVVSGFVHAPEEHRLLALPAADPVPVVLGPADRRAVQSMLNVLADELRHHLQSPTPSADDGIVGSSPQMQRVRETVERIAASDATALIVGESGTGKGLVARAIHNQGVRRERPFVAQNCGAMSETLLESTLFGHVRGAFSGADRNAAGLFAAAHGGTLFLDEVGEMSPHLQVRLLRVLQDGSYSPVGSTETRVAEVRIIAATHRDLRAMVTAGAFRADLFYRLHVLSVEIPPLRARAGDLRQLVEHFARRHDLPPVNEDAWRCLQRYRWPGNVRELESEVTRWTVQVGEALHIGPEHLSPPLRDAGGYAAKSIVSAELPKPAPSPAMSAETNLAEAVAELEAQLIREGLKRTDGNRTQLARELGISRTTLNERLKRYKIDG